MDAATEAARRQMIEQQVRSWDVLDPRVLGALFAVRREQFVPEDYRGVAFADAPIPIGHGQFMLPPALDGRVLQALAPVRGQRALEIGTGTGYFAACLATLAGAAESIEIHADLAARAMQNLEAAGIPSVTVETADAFRRDFEPRYDVIAVTGSVPRAEPRFEQALVVGGRLFIVVGSPPVMEARLVTRTRQETWLTEVVFETWIEPLVRAAPFSHFEF